MLESPDTRPGTRIELDDLSRPAIHALLCEHLDNMRSLSPAESVHALDVDKLRSSDIAFWSAWQDDDLLGVAALKQLDNTHGEIKSMRTPIAARRRGAARLLLNHIIETARIRGYQRLSLETGSMTAFHAAHALYASFGFSFCGPFGAYRADPNSVFMTLPIEPQAS
jgi:putative acetyltransferase